MPCRHRASSAHSAAKSASPKRTPARLRATSAQEKCRPRHQRLVASSAQAQAGALTEGTHRCILEGIYHRTRPILALQWHPELLVDKPLEGTVDPMAVFRYFASLL